MKKLYLYTLLFQFTLLQLFAGVNLKNGNFYVAYLDLSLDSPAGLEIKRTYNSKSTRNGWFGYGWGNSLETYLRPQIDGSILVYEHGAGGLTWFNPVNSELAINDSLLKLLTNYWYNSDKKREHGRSPEEYYEKLKYQKTRQAKLLKSYQKKYDPLNILLSDTLYSSTTRGLQYITVTDNGYIRTKDGKRESFNKNGQLIKIEQLNNAIDIFYDGSLAYKITDNTGNELYLFYNQNNKVERIVSNIGKVCVYHYSENDELLYSKDAENNEYSFNYDEFINMINIRYDNGDKMTMTYEPNTLYVSKVVDRNGSFKVYEYGSNPDNPDNHYWTYVISLSYYGDTVKNYYEYEIWADSVTNNRFTRKLTTEIQGIRTETIYNKHTLPVSITRGTSKTTFRYNELGLLTEKKSDYEHKKIEYDNKTNKIAKVEIYDPETGIAYTTSFNYSDDKLISASNSAGIAVKLSYDAYGNISKIKSDNSIFSIEYNKLNKPTEVILEGIGKFGLIYDSSGDIEEILTDDYSLALNILSELEDLIAIIEPSGVNLNI